METIAVLEALANAHPLLSIVSLLLLCVAGHYIYCANPRR